VGESHAKIQGERRKVEEREELLRGLPPEGSALEKFFL